MSGNWDTYFCQVDGHPAAILVDLALADVAPLAAFPVMGYLSVSLHSPDEHGLPLQEEYERLGALEDHLESAFTADSAGLYAGRSATAGHFDFFFYLQSGERWGERAARIMALFPEYEWEAGSQSDAQWENYICFLFPDEYAMNGMQNRRALRKLEDQDDDPEKSRDIEHWAVFPHTAAAGEFARAIRDNGFTVLEESAPIAAGDVPEGASGVAGDMSGPSPETGISIHFSRPDAPEDIDAVTYPLVALALTHGGAYQGWACPVVA